jgi:hypothetical protein
MLRETSLKICAIHTSAAVTVRMIATRLDDFGAAAGCFMVQA